jgi:hypothetical protein
MEQQTESPGDDKVGLPGSPNGYDRDAPPVTETVAAG